MNEVGDTMRAWTIERATGVSGLRLATLPRPKPGPRNVLVRMRAASLNYRDLQILQGRYARTPSLPPSLIPLSDGAGEVAAVGAAVRGFVPGDRVAGNLAPRWVSGPLTAHAANGTFGAHQCGVLAQYMVVPAKALVRLPSHLSFEEGATLPCAALTAWNAVNVTGRLRRGQTVLVQGTGGVSIFAAQIALALGGRVVATSSRDDRLAKLRKLGCCTTVNYVDTPRWGRAVREFTGGRGADLIVEVGGAGTLAQSLEAVAVGGRISLVGTLAESARIDPRPILVRYASVCGIFAGSRHMFEGMNAFLEAHSLRPIIDRVFPFEKTRDAYNRLEGRKHFGKIVITID